MTARDIVYGRQGGRVVPAAAGVPVDASTSMLVATAALFAAVPGYAPPQFSAGPAEVELAEGWGSHLMVARRLDGCCPGCRTKATAAALEVERCRNCGRHLDVVRVAYQHMT